MCIRFVYCGNDVVTGFNFDIDLSEWDHRVIEDKERFYIGIRRPDGIYHSYHGVNRNGNVGTLLYVHGNGAGAYEHGRNAVTVAELTEWFIQGQVSLDDILGIAKEKKITYAPDATMQAMLSDIHGRVLIIEPGVGVQKERNRYALMSNYSLLNPSSTKMYVLPGDDRYQRAEQWLDTCKDLSISEAFRLLDAVRMEGKWRTRVSFVYSAAEQAVYYKCSQEIKKFSF